MGTPQRMKKYGPEIAAFVKAHRLPPAVSRTIPRPPAGVPAFRVGPPIRHVREVELLTGPFRATRRIAALVTWSLTCPRPSLVWVVGATAGNGPGGRFDLIDGTRLATMTVRLGRAYAAVAGAAEATPPDAN